MAFPLELSQRIADALEWDIKDTESFSLHALREIVRPLDPELAREITKHIESGSYLKQ